MLSEGERLKELIDLYKTISLHRVLVSYQGAVSNEMVMYLGSVIEKKSSLSSKMKRVFGVFLEMAQNIMRYSEERAVADENNQPTGVGRIMVTETDTQIVISGSNAVTVEAMKSLQSQIDRLNGLTKDEQKSLFLERRKLPPPAGSVGAGLGLIEIARKSDTQLEYLFLDHEHPGMKNYLLIATLFK